MSPRSCGLQADLSEIDAGAERRFHDLLLPLAPVISIT